MSIDTEWLIVGELPDVINCVRRSADDVWRRYVPEYKCRIKEDETCYLVCSECGDAIGSFDPQSELYIDGNAIELWDYCPRCGAKVVR